MPVFICKVFILEAAACIMNHNYWDFRMDFMELVLDKARIGLDTKLSIKSKLSAYTNKHTQPIVTPF